MKRDTQHKRSAILVSLATALAVTFTCGALVFAAGEPDDGSDGSVINFEVQNTPIESTLQELSDNDTRTVTRTVTVNVEKTDIDTGDPIEGAGFDLYEDGVLVKANAITTNAQGKGTYTHTETKTFTSETYKENYATNYDSLTPAEKAKTQTQAQAQAKIEAKILADLDAQEAAFKNATHTYELDETTVPDGYKTPTGKFTYTPSTNPNP